MNTFGIDHQPTVTMIALREGGLDGRKLSSVGDGARSMIPNSVAPGGLWGSAAEGQAGLLCAPDPERAWIEEQGATLFWTGMFSRLSSYLGRLAPVRRNGYRLVIALQDADYRTDAHAIRALVRNAGFDDFTLVPATHALLCRWLSSPSAAGDRPRTVVAIAAGESSTLLSAFELDWKPRAGPSIVAASVPGSLERTGFATFNRRLLDLLRKRLSEEPSPGLDRQLRDACLRFAVRLAQAPEDQQVEWRDILEESLYAPFSASYSDCSSWSESSSFARTLPQAVDTALNATGNDSADLLVVGGSGAVWPFAERIAAGLGRVWRSESPTEDVAGGAVWWGTLCDHPSGTLQDGTPIAGAAAPSSSSSPEEPSYNGAVPLPPPWQRGER